MYNIKPNLKDNSWDEIIYASENNIIPNTWNIGDEIDLTLKGKYNETITLQIWDFNHFDKSDGTGKANICFGMKDLMKDRQQIYLSYDDDDSWNNSYMRNVVMKNIYNSIPEYIRNHIKEVNTYANPGVFGCHNRSKGLLSTDKVFIPGLSEIDDWEHQNEVESNQKKFPIFTDDYNSRIKRLNNGDGIECWWWTRSHNFMRNGYFCSIHKDGYSDTYYGAHTYGVCFCFNI